MNHYRIVLPPSKLRDMQRSFISSAFLFPSYNLWQFDEVLASTPKLNYTLNNLEQFFTDVGFKDGWSQYGQVGRMLGQLEEPGVEVNNRAENGEFAGALLVRVGHRYTGVLRVVQSSLLS